MTQSARKFTGVFLLLGLLVAYPLLATWIYTFIPQGASWWVLVVYFAVAGLCWAFPAGAVIKWMARPDAG